MLKLYSELWRLARGHRRHLAGACALLILAQAVLLAVPYVTARALNTLQLRGTAGLTDAGLWLFAIVLIAAVSWVFHGPGRLLERNVSLAVRRRLSTSLLEHLVSLPLAWHESNHSGGTAHRVQQSTHALAAFAQSQYIYLNSSVRLIGPLAALWLIEPVVGLTCVCGFALITASVIGFDRALIRLARQENDAERRYAATLVDTLGNTRTVYALRQARGVIRMLEQRLLAVFEPLKRTIVVNEAKWCVVDLSTRTLSCVLVALFVWRVAPRGAVAGGREALLLGSVYMVWEYANQAAAVVASIAQHFQSFARQQADYASADVIRSEPAMDDGLAARYGDVRDAGATSGGGVTSAGGAVGHGRMKSGLEATTGVGRVAGTAAAHVGTAIHWRRLDVHDLSFRHATERDAAPSLDHVSLSLQCGKRYALIGDSGSGKSTLLRVLAGLYTAERSRIRLDDGAAVLSPADAARILRSSTTLIPQDAEVFAISIAENLGLCQHVEGTPSPDDYGHALRVAQADFLEVSAASLKQEVAERAANWSGGQRSRIALARGVLAARHSSLVLLDEPTAHLDPVTEGQVYTSLFAEFPEACLVSSVHRQHLLDRFDEVLLMQNGQLVAQGTLAELLLGCPEFQQWAGNDNARPSRPATEGLRSEAPNHQPAQNIRARIN